MTIKTAIRNRWVTLYSTSWCPQSRRAKRYLDDAGIAYDNIDIDTDDEGEARVLAWNDGNRSVPTIFVRHILVEPPNNLLDDLLLTPSARVASCAMYATTWCPDCHRSKAWFQSHDIDFEEINMESVEGAVAIVQELSGGMRSVPTIDIVIGITEPPNQALGRLLGLD